MADHLVAAHPCQVAVAAVPSDLPGVGRVGHHRDGRALGRQWRAPRTRARTRVRGHDHEALDRGGVPDQLLRPGGHAAALAVDHDRSRSDPNHRLRGSGLRFHGADARHGPVARIRRQPAGLRPPGGPPSARARPPAALHTGRAALPSAIFPHTLPANPEICWPLRYIPAHRRYRHGACPTRSTHRSAAIGNPSQSNRTPHPQPQKTIQGNLWFPGLSDIACGRIACGRSRPDSNWRSRP